MARANHRKPVSKDRFGPLFSTLKTQSYSEPTPRGSSSSLSIIRTIAWNPTGQFIATGSQGGTLRIWNPEKPNIKNSTELKGHKSAIENVAWNPTKEAELASVSTDRTARFWDVRSNKCIKAVSLGAMGLSICWSPDGALVMAGIGDKAEDEALLPISIPSYAAHLPLPQYGQTNQTAFAPLTPSSKEHTLFISTSSGTVKIVTYPGDEPPTPSSAAILSSSMISDPLSTDPGALSDGLKPSPADSRSQLPSSDPTNDTSTGSLNGQPSSSPLTAHSPLPNTRLITRYTFPTHPSSCTALSLSPTGRHLATGGSDAIVALWDTTDWVCKRALDHCAGSIRNISFSWDGAYIAAASEACSVLDIVHVESGEVVGSVTLDASGGMARAGGSGEGGVGETKSAGTGGSWAQCVAWHPGRYWIAVAGDQGGLRIVGAGGGMM